MFGADDQSNNNQQATNNGGSSQISQGIAPPPNDDLLNGVSEASEEIAEDSSLETTPETNSESQTTSRDDNNLADSKNDDLASIKKQAIAKLSPLIKRLDQSPEEKFRTLLMLVQSTDNKELIKDAYAVTEDISDEQERAKALLAIVNEIDYFTQQN